ncbi:MAG: transposase [Gammaproteobacteria bacterium]
MKQLKTIHLKVKPESYHWLETAAREVNDVWNYCKGTPDKDGKWNSGFDLCYATAGIAKTFMHKINADCVQMICRHYAQKRRQFKKHLKGRTDSGKHAALGFVPFKANSLKLKGNAVRFAGKTFRVFDLKRLLEYGTRKSGCFSQNSLGEWFLNIVVELPEQVTVKTGKSIGIDLGLKTTLTCSDGVKLEAAQLYRNSEPELAAAQRRGHKKQAKRIHAKVKNKRQDALHKFSRKLVNENDLIVIGDVSSSKLAKTRMAKSVLDASWGVFKTMCQYKGQYAGRRVEVISESYTTQACSNCGCLSGPKGLRQLVVRDWICSECNVEHDRDVNSARNILSLAESWLRPSAGTSHASEAGMEPARAA